MKPYLLLLTPFLIGISAAIFRALWIEPISGPSYFVMLALELSAITYGITIALGVPAYLLIQRAGLRAAWQVTLIGAVLGAISGAVLPILVGEASAKQFFSGLYPYPLEYAMFGAITAFAAWWMVLQPTTGTNENARSVSE